MALFGSKKEEKDHQDTSDIKQASSEPKPEENSLPSQSQQNSIEQYSDFNNPFDTNTSTQVNSNIMSQNPTSMDMSVSPFDTNVGAVHDNNTQLNNSLNLNQPTLTMTSDQQPLDHDRIQEMIDETVEKVIEEKWNTVVNNVQKVLSWKDKQEQQMNLIKEDMVTLNENIEKIEKRIVSKISSYDKNILDVNSEIKALEKVFQKVTPTLINNVNELSRIADKFNSREDLSLDKLNKDSENQN